MAMARKTVEKDMKRGGERRGEERRARTGDMGEKIREEGRGDKEGKEQEGRGEE